MCGPPCCSRHGVYALRRARGNVRAAAMRRWWRRRGNEPAIAALFRLADEPGMIVGREPRRRRQSWRGAIWAYILRRMAMHMDGTADAAGAGDVAHVSENGSGDPAEGTATGPAGEERPRRRPGRPTGRPPEGEPETRDQVLRHARRLFMQRGYAGVSVGEVAAAVG